MCNRKTALLMLKNALSIWLKFPIRPKFYISCTLIYTTQIKKKMSKIKTSFTDSQPEYVLSMLSKFWLTLQLPSDQERISPYSVNAILGRQVMRIKKIKKFRDYKLTQYQILQTNITRTVWQTVRRITDEILGVKRLISALTFL